MKDIRKLKMWPLLEKEGFKTKEHRSGNVSFGRGAIFQFNYKDDFPVVEIKPLLNGHWQLSIEQENKSSKWEDSPTALFNHFQREFSKIKQQQKL